MTTAETLRAAVCVGSYLPPSETFIYDQRPFSCRATPATVATRHGGIPEILEEGRTGFMVAERDVETLSRRLAELLETPQKMIELGKAARRHIVEKYDSIRQNEALEEHLIRAARRAPSH